MIRALFASQEHLTTSVDTLVVTWVGRGVKTRDAAKHPIMYKTDPKTKDYPVPTANSAKVENL